MPSSARRGSGGITLRGTALDSEGSVRRIPDVGTALAVHPAARAAREFVLWYVLGPLVDRYTRPRVYGVHHLARVTHPVIFAANHQSHLDTPIVLRSLPGRWRKHTVVLAAADYFFRSRVKGMAVSLVVGAVPVERRGGLGKASADRLTRLMKDGWNILLYPEGTRSERPEFGRFRPGVGYLAVTHQRPIVPIFVHGTYEAMPKGRRWPLRHPVEVHIGAPLFPEPDEDHRALTERLRLELVAMRERARARRSGRGEGGPRPH